MAYTPVTPGIAHSTLPNISRQPAVHAGRLRALLASSLILGLVACASAPLPPRLELQAAENAISNAEQINVTEYAPVEIGQARDKLASAYLAAEKEDMELARRLAIESGTTAELAIARTEMLEARAVNDDMERSIETLTLEMQRNSGAQQ